ncbi:winged helix-turn-helix domain-containing protein [Verrucomicrobiales bacterium BCK34]|nr:winged helix-turn-helix domain-containing protein [Verrucomicrobiales bacterium BCK34]
MDATDATCLPYLKALSDDTRWQIVESLISSVEPMTLGQLATKLGISNYKASRHVSVLEEVGILETRKVGRQKFLAVAESYREHISSGPKVREVLNLGCCSFEFPQEQ